MLLSLNFLFDAHLEGGIIQRNACKSEPLVIVAVYVGLLRKSEIRVCSCKEATGAILMVSSPCGCGDHSRIVSTV